MAAHTRGLAWVGIPFLRAPEANHKKDRFPKQKNKKAKAGIGPCAPER